MFVWKNKFQKKGHYACVRDMMSQTYPIYTSTGTNHTHHFMGSKIHFEVARGEGFKLELENSAIMLVSYQKIILYS